MSYITQNEYIETLRVGHRDTSADLTAALDEEINSRSVDIEPGPFPDIETGLSETDVDAIESLDVHNFCVAFRSARNTVNLLKEQLRAAESKRGAHVDHLQSAMQHLSKLDFDADTINMIIDLLNQNKTRFVTSLNIPQLQRELDAATLTWQRGTSVLDEIKRDLVSGIDLPPDADLPCACPICYTRKVRYALVPCGHTFCEECSENVRRVNCYVCSAMVHNVLKIYV